MAELLHRELTRKLIGVYYDVYNGLSHNYPEYIYESAVAQDLGRRGIACCCQVEYEVIYKDWRVGVQRLDILAAESVVLELKVKPQLGGLDQAQTISYVKTAGKQVGLVFNFGSLKPDFKRVYFSPRAAAPGVPDLEKERDDLLFPALTGEIIGGLFEVHATLGPGFVHRIYANACYRELQARGLAVKPLREMTVYYQGNPLGQVKLRHLQVEDKIMLFPVAIYHQDQLKLENLRRWMADQGISLGILANFYAETLHPIFMRVKC